MKNYIFFIILFFVTSCKLLETKKSKLAEPINGKVDFWHHQDFALDSVYGISLNKWYADNPPKTKSKIIVATLDTQIDLDHEDLQGQFWVNKKEIPNNGIDDDKNGYIDDINGWHFVGKPNGGYYIYGNFEYTRVVREYDSIFKNKKKEDVAVALQKEFDDYAYAKDFLDYYLDYYLLSY